MINFKVFSKHITEKVDGNFSAGEPAGPAAGSFIFNPGSSISSFGKAGFNPKTANSKDNPMNQYFAANMRTRDTHMQTTVDLLAATPGLMPQAIYKSYMSKKSGENPPPQQLPRIPHIVPSPLHVQPYDDPLFRAPLPPGFFDHAPDVAPQEKPKPKPRGPFGTNPDDVGPVQPEKERPKPPPPPPPPPLRSTTAPPQEKPKPKPLSRTPILTPFLTPPYSPDWDPVFRGPIDLDPPKPRPFGTNPGDDAPIAPRPGSRQPQPKPKPFGQNPGDDAPIAPAPKPPPPPPPPQRSTRISSKSASKTSSQPLTFSQLLQNLKGIKANRVSKSYN
jgi:hypothetical protein